MVRRGSPVRVRKRALNLAKGLLALPEPRRRFQVHTECNSNLSKAFPISQAVGEQPLAGEAQSAASVVDVWVAG
jgi:hypothetical protein